LGVQRGEDLLPDAAWRRGLPSPWYYLIINVGAYNKVDMYKVSVFCSHSVFVFGLSSFCLFHLISNLDLFSLISHNFPVGSIFLW
jgi:hypothetical protein